MGKKGGGFGSTLVMALSIVVLGVGISRFDFMASIPVVGPFLFEEQPARTTTSPVVVEIDSTPPVRQHVAAFLESCGLSLEGQRNFGQESHRRHAMAGFATATA